MLHAGVTVMQETSSVSSRDITPTSSLLRAHAPNQCPPSASGITSCGRSLQVAVSPLLRNGSSRRYLCQSFPACLDPCSGCSWGARARCFPQDIGLPRVRTGSAQSHQPTTTSVGHSISELQSFANVQTRRFARHAGSSHLAPCGVRQPWLLHPRLSWFVALPCSGHANRPNPGN